MKVIGGNSFRRWLVLRLVGTNHSTRRIDDEQIEEEARKIGVQPDVLLEARVHAKLLETYGRTYFSTNPSRMHAYRIYMPPKVKSAWAEECVERDLASDLLLRSLLHHYLSNDYEPGRITSHVWVFRGHRLPVREAIQDPVETTVTHGAYAALKRRAIVRGTTRTAIVRALILEALEGRHRAIPLVDISEMHDDEERYYLGPVGLDPLTQGQ